MEYTKCIISSYLCTTHNSKVEFKLSPYYPSSPSFLSFSFNLRHLRLIIILINNTTTEPPLRFNTCFEFSTRKSYITDSHTPEKDNSYENMYSCITYRNSISEFRRIHERSIMIWCTKQKQWSVRDMMLKLKSVICENKTPGSCFQI